MTTIAPILSIGCGLAIAAAAGAAEPPAPKLPAAPTISASPEPAGAIPSAPTPARQYKVAYDSLTQAERLKKQGMAEEAFDLFSEAKSLFQKLAADHPLWETNVVAFRIKYCSDELARLRLATPITSISGTRTGPAANPGLSNAPPVEPQPPPVTAPLRPRPERPPEPVPPPIPADDPAVKERLQAGLEKERAADLKGALENYLSVLEVQSRNLTALKGAGRCCLRAGLPDDARDLLERGLGLPNADAEFNLLMAIIYCYDREYYKAYQLLVIVLDEQPANALAHLVMGVALAGLDKLDNARVETQKAIQLDPKIGDAYYNLARLSFKLKPSSPGVANGYYLNALRYGAAPDPALAKQLQPRN